MAVFSVSYRNEFEATIKAKDEEEAKAKFQSNKAKITCLGDCWNEYFEVEEVI